MLVWIIIPLQGHCPRPGISLKNYQVSWIESLSFFGLPDWPHHVCGGMKPKKMAPELENTLNFIATVLDMVWHIESQNCPKETVCANPICSSWHQLQYNYCTFKILVLLSSPDSKRMHHPWLLSSPNINVFTAKYISRKRGNKTSYTVCRMPVSTKTAGPQKYRLPILT